MVGNLALNPNLSIHQFNNWSCFNVLYAICIFENKSVTLRYKKTSYER